MDQTFGKMLELLFKHIRTSGEPGGDRGTRRINGTPKPSKSKTSYATEVEEVLDIFPLCARAPFFFCFPDSTVQHDELLHERRCIRI